MKALVYCMENWLGIAHMPRLLKNLGWQVDVSSPQGTHISQTRYRDRYLPQGVRTPDPGPIGQLGIILAESRPDFIIPGDDSSTSLLHVYYELGVQNGAPQWELDLIRKSCGNPEYYKTLEFKGAQMELVDKIGIPAPAWRPARLAIDALQFAEEFGYPVVLKTDIGTGGSGVKFCYSEDDVVREAKNLKGTWNVCQFAKGKSISTAWVAYEGVLLEALVFDRSRDNGGKTTVAEIIHKPRLVAHIAKFVAETGYSGFGSMGFILDDQDKEYFLEVNSRATPVGMGAILIGIDLPGALTKALNGEVCTPNHGITGKLILFPQERERDPQMEGLEGIPEFMPVDDPDLMRSFWRTVDAPYPPELSGVNLWEKPVENPPVYEKGRTGKALLFCIDEYWYGAARLPKVLVEGGWEVDVCAPESSLVAKTKFKSLFIPRPSARQMDAYVDLSRAIKQSLPDVIIPGDDRAVAVLRGYYRHAVKSNAPKWEIELLRRSLGNPSHYASLEAKSRQMILAARAGVQLPAWRSGKSLKDALAHTVEHGYPAVLKPDRGSGGVGVSFCHSEADIETALKSLHGSWTISQFMLGQDLTHAFVAVEGKIIDGCSFVKFRRNPPDTGPSTVIDIIDNPALKRMADRFVIEAGYTGFGAFSTVTNHEGEPYFIEFNSRPVPTHAAAILIGLDFGKAFLAGLRGEKYQPDWEPGARIVFYPQERIRDSRLEGLEGAIEDIPQDDPDLLAALEARIKPPLTIVRN